MIRERGTSWEHLTSEEVRCPGGTLIGDIVQGGYCSRELYHQWDQDNEHRQTPVCRGGLQSGCGEGLCELYICEGF